MNKTMIVILTVIFIVSLFTVYIYSIPPNNTVRIGYLNNDQHSSALAIANAKQMYEQEGINVQLEPFNVGADIVIAMAAGQIDLGFLGTTPATMAIDKGMPLKIVAAVNEEGSGIVVGQNSNVTDVNDFKNETVVIPSRGSIQDILLHYLFQNNNISTKQVDIREMQASLMPAAVQSGKIDGYIIWEPYVIQASTSGYGKTFMFSDEIWKNHPCCVIVASDNFRSKNPDTLKKILKVHQNATNFLYTNRNESISILSKRYKMDPNTEKEVLDHIKFLSIPDQEFINNDLRMVDIQRQMGYIEDDLTQNDIFDLQYLP